MEQIRQSYYSKDAQTKETELRQALTKIVSNITEFTLGAV